MFYRMDANLLESEKSRTRFDRSKQTTAKNGNETFHFSARSNGFELDTFILCVAQHFTNGVKNDWKKTLRRIWMSIAQNRIQFAFLFIFCSLIRSLARLLFVCLFTCTFWVKQRNFHFFLFIIHEFVVWFSIWKFEIYISFARVRDWLI